MSGASRGMEMTPPETTPAAWIGSEMQSLATATMQVSGEEIVKSTAYSQAIQRVIVAMRQRLDEPPSLQEMAHIACFSQYYFDRLFRRVTGISPRRYMAALRMAEAKRLLLNTKLSVTDVCFELGYNSLGTFSASF